jgi:hypothetical protein
MARFARNGLRLPAAALTEAVTGSNELKKRVNECIWKQGRDVASLLEAAAAGRATTLESDTLAGPIGAMARPPLAGSPEGKGQREKLSTLWGQCLERLEKAVHAALALEPQSLAVHVEARGLLSGTGLQELDHHLLSGVQELAQVLAALAHSDVTLPFEVLPGLQLEQLIKKKATKARASSLGAVAVAANRREQRRDRRQDRSLQ